MERSNLQKLDASLDHEPGCKVFKGINREWTPMDANGGQEIEKTVESLFAFIRVHSRLINGLGPIWFMERAF